MFKHLTGKICVCVCGGGGVFGVMVKGEAPALRSQSSSNNNICSDYPQHFESIVTVSGEFKMHFMRQLLL